MISIISLVALVILVGFYCPSAAYLAVPRAVARRTRRTVEFNSMSGTKRSPMLCMMSSEDRKLREINQDDSDPRKDSNKNVFVVLANLVTRKVKLAILIVKLVLVKASSRLSTRRTALIEKLMRRPSTPLNALLVFTAFRLTSLKFWFKVGIFFLTLKLVGILPGHKTTKNRVTEVAYSTFLRLVTQYPDKIKQLRVTPNEIVFNFDGLRALTRTVPMETSLMNKLLDSGIEFYAPPSQKNTMALISTLVYCAFLFTMAARMAPPGSSDALTGKRKDQELAKMNLSFADVAGQDKAKLEVAELCEILRNPTKYTSVGARLPSGVLMVGPPGTGKTLLARVTAAEAGVPFYACSASDFVEVYVGRGPARVRKLFETAAKNAPCIIFIDELDSIGRSRVMGFGNNEQENTLNQILTCMDGLDTSNNGVIVMAATNRIELLDPALLRAGRFDRIVNCPLPDRAGREAILVVHTAKLSLEEDVSLDKIAKSTPGTCGADLSAICNEAAIRTARRGGTKVSAKDFDGALTSFFGGRGVVAPAATATGIAEGLNEWAKKMGVQTLTAE